MTLRNAFNLTFALASAIVFTTFAANSQAGRAVIVGDPTGAHDASIQTAIDSGSNGDFVVVSSGS